jgi:hypothetical protein
MILQKYQENIGSIFKLFVGMTMGEQWPRMSFPWRWNGDGKTGEAPNG